MSNMKHKDFDREAHTRDARIRALASRYQEERVPKEPEPEEVVAEEPAKLAGPDTEPVDAPTEENSSEDPVVHDDAEDAEPAASDSDEATESTVTDEESEK